MTEVVRVGTPTSGQRLVACHPNNERAAKNKKAKEKDQGQTMVTTLTQNWSCRGRMDCQITSECGVAALTYQSSVGRHSKNWKDL